MLKVKGKNYIQFYVETICLSKPVNICFLSSRLILATRVIMTIWFKLDKIKISLLSYKT